MRVEGRTVTKPSARVAEAARIEVAAPERYVARSARKLVAALDAFPVDPAGMRALDVGASTGGFTQVLLERGCRQVVALDVGHDQLAPALRADPRVIALEGVNIRDLDRDGLARLAGPEPVALVVVDVSFISLTLVLPAIARIAPDADVVALVKPQFEVGRGAVREGVVRGRAARIGAVTRVLRRAEELGYRVAGIVSSPVPGTAGNLEALAHLRPGVGGHPTEWEAAVSALP